MRIIYSVHMPLFMGIAGYLSYFSLQKYSVLSYITRRWRQLFPPILLWATSLLCMKIILTGHIPHVLQILTSILTTFWFLWAILICSSLVCLCEQIKNSKIKLAVYVGLLIIFACTPDILWWNAHKFMFVCFLSGFYVAKYQFALHITWIKAGMASVLWVISIVLFHKEAYIYTSGFSVVFTQFPNFYDQILMDLFRYISAVLGTISVSYICLGFTKFIQKGTAFTHSLTIFLSFCGKNSLAIYILSTYQFVYLLPQITKSLSPNLLLNMAETLVIVGICLGMQQILSKNKYLSQLIIGK